MGHPEAQNRRPAVEQLISNFPRLFVKRDNLGHIHVHYPLTTGVRREMIISPFKSPDPKDTTHVSILISDVSDNLPPDAPVAATARLVLKPITSSTFEVDQTEAGDVSFPDVVRPIRQGFDLLTTFLANPPADHNPYTANVLDELNLVDGEQHIGSFVDPAAMTYLKYVNEIMQGEPTPELNIVPAPEPAPATV